MDYNGLESTLHVRLKSSLDLIDWAEFSQNPSYLLDENGDFIITEDGNTIIVNNPIPLIKYPNILYDDSEETPIWLRPSVLYGAGESAVLGATGKNRLNGIYQISIFSPLNTGTYEANLLAKWLLSRFKKGERLSFGQNDILIGVGYQSTSMEEESYLHTPITIPFTAYMEVS